MRSVGRDGKDFIGCSHWVRWIEVEKAMYRIDEKSGDEVFEEVKLVFVLKNWFLNKIFVLSFDELCKYQTKNSDVQLIHTPYSPSS